MRILYHHRTRLEDAQGVHIQEMVEAFRALGHEVQLASLVGSNGTTTGTRGMSFSRLTDGVPDWVYEVMSLGYNLYGYRLLARAIAEFRPHVIYERYALNTVCGVWASRRFAVPLLLEVNAPLYREQADLGRLTFRRLARRSERWVCSSSTRTIVVSGVMRDMLAAEGVPASHMTVMPNGINPRHFNATVSGGAVRERYGLHGKVVVGVVGWFRQWHGVQLLVESMHRGGLLTDAVRLLLVGAGPAYADAVAYAEVHRLSDTIVFTGPVPQHDVPAHIAAMDITVQPSATGYACPLKLIEYMAMGRCILAPDQPNIREIVDDGVTAHLFPGDSDRLCARLAELIHDGAVRTAIGGRARKYVLDRRMTWGANAERALNLLGEPPS